MKKTSMAFVLWILGLAVVASAQEQISPPDLEWQQVYGGYETEAFASLLPLPEGEFLVLGSSYSPPGGSKTAPYFSLPDYWVVRANAAGDQVWDRSFGGSSNELAWCAQMAQDGGLILGGASESLPGGTKTAPHFGGYDFWVVRTDPNGQQLWDASFGGQSDDTMYCVAEMPDGGFVLGGRSNSSPSGNKTSPNRGGYDYWLVRLDASGRKVWEQTFGGSEDEYLYSVAVTKEGGLILGGWSSSGQSGNKACPNRGKADYWIIRLNMDGHEVWEATYGGSRADELRAIVPTPDGGFLLGGHSSSPVSGNKTVPDYYFGDYWVLKLGPERPALRFPADAISATGLRLSLVGIKGVSYRTEWSSNLRDWTALQTNRLTNSTQEIVDTSIGRSVTRFYRAKVVPAPY